MPEFVILEKEPTGLPAEHIQATILAYQQDAYAALQEIAVEAAALQEPTAAARQYLEGLGLETPPLIFFDSNDPVALARIAEYDPAITEGFTKGVKAGVEGYLSGALSNRLQIAFVDPARLTRASTIAHELAHGSELKTHLVAWNAVTRSLNYGCIGSGWSGVDRPGAYGSLLGEGRAEFLAGHSTDLEEKSVNGKYFADFGFGIPNSRLETVGENSFRLQRDHLGAIAVDLLIAHDPSLLEAVLFDPTIKDGPGRTAEKLNAILPNLYDIFCNVDAHDPDPTEATELVTLLVSQLHDGNPKAPLISYAKTGNLLQARLAANDKA